MGLKRKNYFGHGFRRYIVTPLFTGDGLIFMVTIVLIGTKGENETSN